MRSFAELLSALAVVLLPPALQNLDTAQIAFALATHPDHPGHYSHRLIMLQPASFYSLPAHTTSSAAFSVEDTSDNNVAQRICGHSPLKD